VEAFRQKQVRFIQYLLEAEPDDPLKTRASDDKHAERAARQAEQQRTDMQNSKKCASTPR